MKPACGYSLKRASYVVAILEIAFAGLAAAFYAMGLTAVRSSNDLNQIRNIAINFRIPFVNLHAPGTKLEDVGDALTTAFSIGLTTSLLAVAFGVLLYFGIKQACLLKLKIWVIYEAVMLTIAVVYLLLIVLTGYATVMSAFTELSSILVHSYFCWIVYSFRQDVLTNQVLDITPKIVQTQGTIAISFPMQTKP